MLSSECWRQSVFGRLAGYEDVNDAERLRHDPAMRWIVGGNAALGAAASPSQMGRFETRWLTAEKNLSALADWRLSVKIGCHSIYAPSLRKPVAQKGEKP
jgi:hypothetical protein